MKKPGQLSGSCKMSANDAGMIMAVAPGRHSKAAVDRKFVCRVSKYCSDDKGVDQAGTCWPFMAELARCNGDHLRHHRRAARCGVRRDCAVPERARRSSLPHQAQHAQRRADGRARRGTVFSAGLSGVPPPAQAVPGMRLATWRHGAMATWLRSSPTPTTIDGSGPPTRPCASTARATHQQTAAAASARNVTCRLAAPYLSGLCRTGNSPTGLFRGDSLTRHCPWS